MIRNELTRKECTQVHLNHVIWVVVDVSHKGSGLNQVVVELVEFALLEDMVL